MGLLGCYGSGRAILAAKPGDGKLPEMVFEISNASMLDRTSGVSQPARVGPDHSRGRQEISRFSNVIAAFLVCNKSMKSVWDGFSPSGFADCKILLKLLAVPKFLLQQLSNRINLRPQRSTYYAT
jgi:hypothetical protein